MGLRPSSLVTRVLSKTVFQVRYGMNTFSSAAPYASEVRRLENRFTPVVNGFSRKCKPVGPRTGVAGQRPGNLFSYAPQERTPIDPTQWLDPELSLHPGACPRAQRCSPD